MDLNIVIDINIMIVNNIIIVIDIINTKNPIIIIMTSVSAGLMFIARPINMSSIALSPINPGKKLSPSSPLIKIILKLSSSPINPGKNYLEIITVFAADKNYLEIIIITD